MQLVLDNLAAQEAALTAMFTGVKSANCASQRWSGSAVPRGTTTTSVRRALRLSAVTASAAPRWVAAVYIHGIAGKIASRRYGVRGTTAEDIADAIGQAIESITNPQS